MTGCWHKSLPANDVWPDAHDFKDHITKALSEGRMSYAMFTDIATVLKRARTRLQQNPHYVLHSYYLLKQTHWLRNFLVPLCETDNSLPSAFCAIQDAWPYEKRTILSLAQAQEQLQICCPLQQAKYADIILLPWNAYTAKYPAPAPTPAASAAPSSPAALAGPSRTAQELWRLNNYLNGYLDSSADDVEELLSPFHRLNDKANQLLDPAIECYNLTHEDADLCMGGSREYAARCVRVSNLDRYSSHAVA